MRGWGRAERPLSGKESHQPHRGTPGGKSRSSGSGTRHPKGSSYPSSAPDTMCSSLMSWMLSMEPLAKGAVRGMAPLPSTLPNPAQRISLLVAIEDKLGLLRDLPHAHRPVSAPGRHAALPAQGIQRGHGVLVPKAGGGQRQDGSHMNKHTHPHTLSPHTLTVSPHRSSPPHSTPSQSGRGTCCRAGGCLCGRPAPKGTQRAGERGPELWQARRVRPREDFPKSRSQSTGVRAHSLAIKQLQTSQRAPCFLGKPTQPLPALPYPFTPSCPLQCHRLHRSTGSLTSRTPCLIHPITQAPPNIHSSYRHSVPVSRESVQVPAALGLPNENKLAAVTRGLWR